VSCDVFGDNRDAIMVNMIDCRFGALRAEFEYLAGGQYYSVSFLF
jgi:hypothetical protein